MQTNLTAQQLYTLMAGLKLTKRQRRLLSLQVRLAAFQRDIRYYCVTVPLAAVLNCWRLYHPGRLDSGQDW